MGNKSKRNKSSTRSTSGPKVVIGYCHDDFVNAFWHASLIRVLWNEGRLISTVAAVHSGPKIDGARNDIVRQFLDTNATHLLMVDTDMILPPNIASKLLAHDKDIAGALAFIGSFHGAPVRPNLHIIVPDEDGNPTITVMYDYPVNSLVQVDGTGAACMLIKRKVIEEILLARGEDHPLPWFAYGMHNNVPIGEDIAFCLTAGKIGFETWVDTSMVIPHAKLRFLTDREYVLALSQEDHPYYDKREKVPIYKELISDGNTSLDGH